VTQPITLVRGYKNVAVKVVTTGQIANGYRLTNISVTPLNVTVYSDNPTLVNELPGYVETKPVDLTGLNDDIEMRMELNLPKGISLVGEQSVLVQVSVAAIEGSLTVSLPVETLGLSPELTAHISPGMVDVIVTGPLPVLDTLTQASFRAVVDVSDMAPGVYQMIPVVDLVPEQVRIQTILPETVEVSITITPTPTATTTANPVLVVTPSSTQPAP
jgi:YbbR domain-containing protein